MSSKRIVAGTVVSYLNTGFSMAANIVLVPLYLHYLGKEQYGLWLVVLSLVSYLGLSNLGIAQIVSNLVAGANAKNDKAGVRGVVATGFWLYVCIISVALVFVVGIVLFAPLEKLFTVSDGLEQTVIPVVIISSVFFLLQLPFSVFRVTLRSLNLIYKEQLLGILFTGIQAASVLFLLLSRPGVVGLSVVYGAAGVISGAILFLYLRRIFPELSISAKLFDTRLARELISPGLYFFILQLAGAMIWGTGNVIIGYVLGATAVAPYGVAFKIFMMATSIVNVVTSNMLPAITSAYALKDKHKLAAIYSTMLKLCLGIGLLGIMLLISVGPELMVKWIGRDNYVGNPTFYWFLCLIFVQISLFPADAILTGTTHHRRYAVVAVLEGLLNVGLSIWWVKLWGVPGVAAATLVARLVTNGWFMVYRANDVTGIDGGMLYLKNFKALALPSGGAMITVYILGLLSISGWAKIVIDTMCISIVFSSLFYFLTMDEESKTKLNRLIRGYNGA